LKISLQFLKRRRKNQRKIRKEKMIKNKTKDNKLRFKRLKNKLKSSNPQKNKNNFFYLSNNPKQYK